MTGRRICRRDMLHASSAIAVGMTIAPQLTATGATPSFTGPTQQSNEGIGYHYTEPYDFSGVMQGFPPPPDKQVTRDNMDETQAKMRWAAQHWRELYPTQRVSRGRNPIIALPRNAQELMSRQFCDTADEPAALLAHLERLHVNAFLVLKRGAIVCEDYFHGMTPETTHETYSVRKSIEATVIATLLGEGKLDEHAPIEQYVPELAQSGCAGATVRQMLDMESGVKYDVGVGDASEFSRHCRSLGPAARELGVPVGNYNYLPAVKQERPHGSRMAYKEVDPAALIWAAEKVTGKRFATLLSERIWSKIGAEFDADATCDQLGHYTVFLAITLRDFAAGDRCVANDGAFNNEQVVPTALFQDIRRNATPARLAPMPLLGKLMPEGVGYRSFFYHHQPSGDAIAAAGAYGQFCYINPKYETVVAMFSTVPPLAPGRTSRPPLHEPAVRSASGGTFVASLLKRPFRLQELGICLPTKPSLRRFPAALEYACRWSAAYSEDPLGTALLDFA